MSDTNLKHPLVYSRDILKRKIQEYLHEEISMKFNNQWESLFHDFVNIRKKNIDYIYLS